MTREESNRIKTELIAKVKAGIYDNETYKLLKIFCVNSHTMKLENINRSLEAYPTNEAMETKKEVQKVISEKIEKWIKLK